MLGTLFLVASLSAGTIDPALARHVATLDAGDDVRLLVFLEDRYDGATLRRATTGLPRSERAERVRAILSEHAQESQRELRAELDRMTDARPLSYDSMLWIVNARAVTCAASEVEAIAQCDGVERVVWDPPLDLEDARPSPPAPPAPPAAAGGTRTSGGSSSSRATSNVIGHQATALWDVGIDGSGVLIVNIDSGVARDHPALAPSIWSNPNEDPDNGVDDDGNGFVDDYWGWDFAANNNEPYDGGHGTNVAGILVGNGAGNGGTATGMAPGATMAVTRASTAGHLLESYQYAISIGADCISSSHSVKWGSLPDYHAFRDAMEVELAAGIVHANSIGNRGFLLATDPIPWNIATPGNCPGPWIHPSQTTGGVGSVISVGGILVGSDDLYAFGSQGPSAWEDVLDSEPSYPHAQDPAYWDYPWWKGTSPGLLKPDLAAYTSVETTQGSNLYIPAFGGTSASTPHVGGALCLLLQQNPNALPRQVSQALQETALDLEDPGKDTRTGAGKLMAYDAAMRIRSLVTLLPNDPAPGESFDLVVSGPAQTSYLLLIGAQPGPFTTNVGVELELSDPSILLTGTHAGQDDPFVLTIAVPPSPALRGLQVHFQSLTDESSGITGSWLVSLLETLTIR